MLKRALIVIAGIAACAGVSAQQVSTAGALVIIPASGQVTHANDMATAVFFVEEQDSDKARAASRVNEKMREGGALLRKLDPTAKVETDGYNTVAIYPDDDNDSGMSRRVRRTPVAWRVSQSISVQTLNLAALPKTVAGAQRLLALQRLQFELSPALRRKLDSQRLAATYHDFNARIADVAAAMGRKLDEAVVDTIDFEGAGASLGQQGQRVTVTGSRMAPAVVELPVFEPGETTLDMRLVAKVRFK